MKLLDSNPETTSKDSEKSDMFSLNVNSSHAVKEPFKNRYFNLTNGFQSFKNPKKYMDSGSRWISVEKRQNSPKREIEGEESNFYFDPPRKCRHKILNYAENDFIKLDLGVEKENELESVNNRISETNLLRLSEEQQLIHDFILNEAESVFYTGPAGSGKSFLTRELIKSLQKKHGRSSVAVTASTGIAACNIGGSTLHSYAGLGLADKEADKLLLQLERNKSAKKRWEQTKVLVIDEVSMVDGDFFDTLEYIGRKIRDNEDPFGGIQLVLVGDFYQLPPVSKDKRTKGEKPLCFEAKSWPYVINHTFMLTEVFRQRDSQFIEILNEMRLNKLSQTNISIIKQLSRPVQYDDGVLPTELYPLRNQVDRANRERLNALPGELKSFVSEDRFARPGHEEFLKKRLNNSCMAPEVLQIKTNAQVMLVTNLDQSGGLVNGSVGIIVGFEDKTGHPVVEFPRNRNRDSLKVSIAQHEWSIQENGKDIAVRKQYPLILAWALSVHKSQGQTIERLKIDLSKTFEKGQAYVALSRATNFDTLQVLNFNPLKVKAHPRVVEFSKTLKKVSALLFKPNFHTSEKPMQGKIQLQYHDNENELPESKMSNSQTSDISLKTKKSPKTSFYSNSVITINDEVDNNQEITRFRRTNDLSFSRTKRKSITKSIDDLWFEF